MAYNIRSIEQRYAHYGAGMLLQEMGGPKVPDGNQPTLYAGLDFGRNGLDETVNSRVVQALARYLSVELTSAGSAVHIKPPVPLEQALQIGRVVNGHSTEMLVKNAKKPKPWKLKLARMLRREYINV